jgi:hypothetical protein
MEEVMTDKRANKESEVNMPKRPPFDIGHYFHSGTLGITGPNTFGEQITDLRSLTLRFGRWIKRRVTGAQP